jgi:hypothetical protein
MHEKRVGLARTRLPVVAAIIYINIYVINSFVPSFFVSILDFEANFPIDEVTMTTLVAALTWVEKPQQKTRTYLLDRFRKDMPPRNRESMSWTTRRTRGYQSLLKCSWTMPVKTAQSPWMQQNKSRAIS